MKKEIFSVCLLAVMLASAIVNIHCLSMLAENISALVSESISEAKSGRWEEAQTAAENAESVWASQKGYTHIVLRHNEIDTVSDALYDFISHINEHDVQASAAAADKVKYHLDSIYRMEQVRFGSIF